MRRQGVSTALHSLALAVGSSSASPIPCVALPNSAHSRPAAIAGASCGRGAAGLLSLHLLPVRADSDVAPRGSLGLPRRLCRSDLLAKHSRRRETSAPGSRVRRWPASAVSLNPAARKTTACDTRLSWHSNLIASVTAPAFLDMNDLEVLRVPMPLSSAKEAITGSEGSPADLVPHESAPVPDPPASRQGRLAQIWRGRRAQNDGR
jgi:hypothetical protein